MTNLKEIEKLAKELNNDIEKVQRELKRVASIKCRLKKQKAKSSYEKEMTSVLAYEQSLKEVKQLLQPKEKTVTTYNQEDVDLLDYDQTIKAIRSIQSKKALTKWLTENEGENDEYKEACRIEQMLQEHKKELSPITESSVRKSDVQTIIDTLESSGKMTKETMVELLKNLL